jgi:energy-coupling factor transport system substrate-specific component
MSTDTNTGFFGRAKEEFTTQTWVLIPMCVALSVVATYLVNVVKIPFLYLDAVGVILIAILAGPWAAAITGLFVNVVNGFLVAPSFWAWTPLQIAFGLAAGYMAMNGWFRKFWKIIVVGLVIAAISIVMGAPITVVAFGGVTGTGSDAVTAFFSATGANIWGAVFSQTLVIEPIDKITTVVLAALIAKQIPMRYLPETASKVLDRKD